MAAIEYKRMIDLNYSSICELLPSTPSSVQNLRAFVRGYIQRMKKVFVDQPHKYAMFSWRLQEAAYWSVAVVLDECGYPAIRLKDVPPAEVKRIRDSVSLEGYDDLVPRADSFLHRKFDELPGLVDVEERVDEGLVSKWCGLISKVGDKLSGSGGCNYELLRQLSNFNLGLINRCELGVVVADMIGKYPDLMQEFGSLLIPLDYDDEDEDGEDSLHVQSFFGFDRGEWKEEEADCRSSSTDTEEPEKEGSIIEWNMNVKAI